MARGRKRTADNSVDGAAVVQSLQSKRTNSSTKRTYLSKVNAMKEWLVEHFPATVDLETATLRLPLPKDAVLGFFGHLCSPASTCDRENIHTNEASSAPLSTSCVWGYRSALVDVYRAKFLELEPDLDTELRRALDGYEKVINNLKKRGLMKINEGKQHLKSTGFGLLALKLMTDTPTRKGQSWATIMFGWSYFVLMWNLMSRSDSVDTIMLQHLDWSEDCLTVEEQGHKGDQTGAEKFGKHVYANPYEPSQCPVLALAVHLFSCPERGSGGKQQLYLGTDNKNRFGRILRRLVTALGDDELAVLGCSAGDVGTHSLRKGSSSYALGQVNGPTPVSVYLRMGQSLGKLKDRYIHFGEGADQLCGRMIAGLPFNSERFAVLPPHFPVALTSKMNIDYWNQVVSGYSNYPRGVQVSFPFLLASIIHHEQYLRETLVASHPIFKARVFIGNRFLDQQRGATILAIGESTECGLKATGIPAHLAIANQVNLLRDELNEARREMDLLKANVAEKLPSDVASKVVSELRQHFVVQGVTPVSLHDIDTRFDTLRTSLASEFRQAINDIAAPNQSATANLVDEQRPIWSSWNWSDSQISHAVPAHWEFPARCSVKTMWNLWFFGDKDTGIRPYRLLSKQHDIKPSHQMRHSRVRIVMEFMQQLVKEAALLPSGVHRISKLQLTTADEVFQKAFATMLNLIYPSTPKRAEELAL